MPDSRFVIGLMIWMGVFPGLSAVAVAQPSLQSSPGRQAATVEDSVRLRTFIEEQPLAVSPDGRQVAYVLIEPDQKKNRNETVLYARDLPKMEAKQPQRGKGQVVLRTQGIRQMQWLADGRHLLVLHHPEGGRQNVVRVDRQSGEVMPASPADLDVEAFAATPDGRRLALLVKVPDTPQRDRFASPRGVIITEEDFLLDVDARNTAKNKATLTAVVVADAGGSALTVFGGKRSLTLMRPAISSNGCYVTFLALGEALPYPDAWQRDPAFHQWPQHGFTVPQSELVLAELPATLPATPGSGPGRPPAVLRLALDAGCISDHLWGLAALWSDNNESYLVCGPGPVGDGSAVKEALIGPFRPQHLFAVNARTGAAERVMDDTPRQMLAFDEQARRVVVMLRNGDLVTLRRSARAPARGDADSEPGGAWKEEQRLKLPASGMGKLSGTPGDTHIFVGIHQTTTTPPDLWLLDAKTGYKAALTQINPELQEQTLGWVERINWAGANASNNWGYLIYPVGYQENVKYPCVILCKSWDSTFIHGGNGGLIGNFAPQALANCGFVVLMLEDAVGPYLRGTWKNLPGGVSEAFRAMDAMETARRELNRRRLIDPMRVGLMGFSRTSWKVDFTLTHSKEPWAAAVSADSGIYNYGTYLGDRNLRSGMAAMYGGPPCGDTFKAWLDNAPPFSAANVRTPLLMQYHGKVSMAAEFYSALSVQGKPVELVLFPEGEHILKLPLQRIGSMQGSVDWFRFWLQKYENPNPQYPGQYARWRKLRVQHEWNEKMIAEGKDPAAEFIKQQKTGKK